MTGFSIFAAFEGFSPIFGYLRPGHFDHLLQLPTYIVIGVVAGLVGLLFHEDVLRHGRGVPSQLPIPRCG